MGKHSMKTAMRKCADTICDDEPFMVFPASSPFALAVATLVMKMARDIEGGEALAAQFDRQVQSIIDWRRNQCS